jgi:hypothetical protein
MVLHLTSTEIEINGSLFEYTTRIEGVVDALGTHRRQHIAADNFDLCCLIDDNGRRRQPTTDNLGMLGYIYHVLTGTTCL